jgi:hypothetical protein
MKYRESYLSLADKPYVASSLFWQGAYGIPV